MKGGDFHSMPDSRRVPRFFFFLQVECTDALMLPDFYANKYGPKTHWSHQSFGSSPLIEYCWSLGWSFCYENMLQLAELHFWPLPASLPCHSLWYINSFFTFGKNEQIQTMKRKLVFSQHRVVSRVCCFHLICKSVCKALSEVFLICLKIQKSVNKMKCAVSSQAANLCAYHIVLERALKQFIFHGSCKKNITCMSRFLSYENYYVCYIFWNFPDHKIGECSFKVSRDTQGGDLLHKNT